MKILKHGDVREFTCKACGCRYVAGINEVGDAGFYQYMACPECGVENNYKGENDAGGNEQAPVQEAVQGGDHADR